MALKPQPEKPDRPLSEAEILERETARFRAIFDQLQRGVTVYGVVDQGGDFIFLDQNRAAERLSGRKKEESLGRRVSGVLPETEDAGLLKVFGRVWRTGESERHSTFSFKDDDLMRWWDNYVHRLPSGEIIVVQEDITERKRAEEMLFAYQEQLQALASELSRAEERERRRIATELHDHIGQNLSVIKMKLLEARKQCRANNGTGDRLDDILDLLNQTIRETRTLTFELSPPVLYELGLDAALEWLVENFQEKYGLKGRFVCDGQPKPLDEEVSVVLFRSARELLINVVKHAKPREAEVSVGRERDRIRIMIEDKGPGFDLDGKNACNIRTKGFGLFNIRERLELLGGYLGLESEAGSGTRVTLVAPLRTAGESSDSGGLRR